MKKILVPVDNSKVSKTAVLYAVNLAAILGGEIVLLSVINATSTSSTLSSWRLLEEQLVNEDREGVEKMLREVYKATGTSTKITHKHVLGFSVPEMIDRFVLDNKIDLVVMGTSGAKGLKKVLGGTNTAAVIDECSVPVITVPTATLAKRIRRIVYATDMTHLDEEIKLIANFARPFDAAIEVVHMTENGTRKRNRGELESILIRMAKYPRIHLNITKNIGIAKGLRAFASKHKADMIVMFTHELDFFEKLFGKGRTRQVAFESTIPLLAFNRTTTRI